MKPPDIPKAMQEYYPKLITSQAREQFLAWLAEHYPRVKIPPDKRA